MISLELLRSYGAQVWNWIIVYQYVAPLGQRLGKKLCLKEKFKVSQWLSQEHILYHLRKISVLQVMYLFSK